MGRKVSIDGLADAVARELKEYEALTSEGMKAAVKKAGDTVRNEIRSSAPRRTGAYAKSWAVKKTKESGHALEVTVHSRNRYQIAHLLEHGHAKRGGGRVSGRAHIAPAEETGIVQLEKDIARCIRNG